MDLHVGNAHDVGKYARSCYAGSGTVTLNHHGVFAVAFGGQQYDVVAAFQSVERMADTYFLQADRCLAVFQSGHEAPVLAFGFEYLAAGFKVSIQAGHLLPEVIQRAFKEVIGYK